MIYKRILNLPKSHSFFLFGGRGTGKSTLLRSSFSEKVTLTIDLLDLQLEEAYSKNPMLLKEVVLALPKEKTHIIVDEIQKIPKLLDVVHLLIETTDKKFIMSGSSAKKLKKGGANLLAGRAFVYSLFPLSFLELGEDFHLQQALSYGTLPGIYKFQEKLEWEQFLRAYAQIYLREEVWIEQLVKNLNPFRRFLEVSAQSNGKILNVANISRDVGVDDKTIQNYFHILEDTLIGFYLEPFHHSFRKRLSKKPKFYFFDTGVVRTLSSQLSLTLQQGTSAYGEAFEHFIICECYRLTQYLKPDFKLSFLLTKDDVEVDLVIERPGMKTAFIEITSSENMDEFKLRHLNQIITELGKDRYEAYCFSNEKYKRQIYEVTVFPWQDGIRHVFQVDS